MAPDSVVIETLVAVLREARQIVGAWHDNSEVTWIENDGCGHTISIHLDGADAFLSRIDAALALAAI